MEIIRNSGSVWYRRRFPGKSSALRRISHFQLGMRGTTRSADTAAVKRPTDDSTVRVLGAQTREYFTGDVS